ncbi:MAG: hypothetical protein A2521_08430 [Deltaproteobacteria bacterium RIFOXYD12_FULL_57_12]|nr:MAG: hypothetical protein A2521_08430 [Deltaproteobacteria bacterium RIFOXYD12_FULL_57_12]
MKTWHRLLLALCLFGALGYAYWKFAIPTHRVDVRSELVMLGDLDGDNRWTATDLATLEGVLQKPFDTPSSIVWRIDMNQNGMIDDEDLRILRALVASAGDPYAAEEQAHLKDGNFPRPRELYRYISIEEYRPRPLWALPYPLAADSILVWLKNIPTPASTSSYPEALTAAVYDEAVRFDQAWRQRESQLLPIEREYAARKLAHVKALFRSGAQYELLLALMELVEDAETLTVRGQPEFPLKLLTLRDHLREVLGSPLYAEFKAGKQDWRTVLKVVSDHILIDLGLAYDFETLGPPRNLTHLANYLQRAEWQYYKSTARENDFRQLIAFAQHDPRYLRAVARTSKRLQDPNVENHNLPMVLLLREALRIKDGDKKKAVGLLDEAIRIPYAWIKSISREALPGSLALDNFLLPGNMEDGADKSRHWNVFGGICLYKSPQEALDLALKREMKDLCDANYSEDAMREFLRDMTANLNGMYHVMTVNPGLLAVEHR